MKFIVRFVAHLIEEKRPGGFPSKVHTDINVQTDSRDVLKKAINDFLAVMVMQRGMVIDKPQDFSSYEGLKPDYKDLDSRIFVPYHMFAYIETVTKLVSAKVEPEGDEGDEVPSSIPLQ